MCPDATQQICFKPIDDDIINEISRRQSGTDLADMFDCIPNWAPLSAAQLREKISEELKKPRTALFAIFSGKELVGIGQWSASWDTWSPYAWFVVMPEHRRRDLGEGIARILLDKCFMENPGHELAVGISASNSGAAALLIKLGFKGIGRMRRVGMEAGNFHDVIFYDILKSEYLAGVKP